MVLRRDHDLVIVGGGPAGLSAAINGSSEGLDVLLLDSGQVLGGQARESASIENYPGFPDGITGDALMTRLVQQARKFDSQVLAPCAVWQLRPDGQRIVVTDDAGDEFISRAVLLALGLSYRRLQADNLGEYMGRGVFYGVPNGNGPKKTCKIAVVGGANSAGQAVLNLARNHRAEIKLLVRKTIEAQMSTYLIDRIRQTENITICENCEVVSAHGANGRLSWVQVKDKQDGVSREIEAEFLFVFIGAQPRTYWLRGTLDLDGRGFVITEGLTDAGSLPYETSMRSVFAAGDVRSENQTKRIAAAAGEGSAALQMIHRRLA